MDIIKEIVEQNLISSKKRFEKNIFSQRSHKRLVLEKDGKSRVIFVPNKIVKLAQRHVLTNYLEPLTCSDSCYSYQKGKSIVNMADAHCKNNYFLHIDIKHYFDNMDYEIFKDIILKHYAKSKIAEAVTDKYASKQLRAILTFRNHFRQGSITSPYVSNLYLFEFDLWMKEYVNSFVKNGIYTRYSDDILISSTSRIDKCIINLIKEKLRFYMLRLNYKKIYFSSIKSSARVTGLSITSEHRITLNTKYKSNLKKMIYDLLEKNVKTNFNVLFGYLYYLMMCDPTYFNKLQLKYKKDKVLMLDRIKKREQEANNLVCNNVQ